MIKKLSISCFSFCFIATQAMALVDYTESPAFTPKNSGAKSVRRKASKPAMKKISRSRGQVQKASGGSTGMFSLGTTYETLNVEQADTSGKASFLKLKGHFETNYNIFLDFSYWQADNQSEQLGETKSHKGNPEMVLGLNWLEFGSGADSGNISFVFGYVMGQDNSSFAHSRSDKIVGVETSKRFYDFALGLGYRFRMTGSPSSEQEMDIGNIGQLVGTLGWMATPDIRFLVEGGTYSIASNLSSSHGKKLTEDLSFGYVSPTALLGISPYVQLEMGAVFRSKRLKGEDLVDARLYNLKGAYGNSIFAGLNMSI